MTDGELRLLRRSAATGEELLLTLSECWYRCCAKPWERQTGALVYTGRVMAIDERELMVVKDGIGTITFSLTAQLADVIAVAIASDDT